MLTFPTSLRALAMLWLKKINSNINMYNTDNNKMRKSNFWEFNVFHYFVSDA